jgi:hypothetical protein
VPLTGPSTLLQDDWCLITPHLSTSFTFVEPGHACLPFGSGNNVRTLLPPSVPLHPARRAQSAQPPFLVANYLQRLQRTEPALVDELALSVMAQRHDAKDHQGAVQASRLITDRALCRHRLQQYGYWEELAQVTDVSLLAGFHCQTRPLCAPCVRVCRAVLLALSAACAGCVQGMV